MSEDTLKSAVSAQGTKRGSSEYMYKLFRVRRSDGRITTVSIDPILATCASRTLGSIKEVGRVVRKAALEYEPEVHKSNCSRYAANSLIKEMASRQQPGKR